MKKSHDQLIILAMVVLFVAGCSGKGRDCPGAVQSSRTLRPLIGQRLEMTEEIRKISWDAYIEATDLQVDAMESAVVASEFVLARDVQGLGKKGDKIHEVRFTLLGGTATRGLILVNEKTKEPLVVFPKKQASAVQKNLPEKK
jgi:hypothetical protein